MIISRFPKRVPIAVSSTYELLKTYLKLEELREEKEEGRRRMGGWEEDDRRRIGGRDEEKFERMEVEERKRQENGEDWRREEEGRREEEEKRRMERRREEEWRREEEGRREREEEIYREALLQVIRIASQLSDIYQTNRNFSLNKVLETIGMVEHEFISEIRHMATHKHLPSKILIRKSVEYLLNFFLDKFWRRREEGGRKEEVEWRREEGGRKGEKGWRRKEIRKEEGEKGRREVGGEGKRRREEGGGREEGGRELFKMKSLSGFKRRVGIMLTTYLKESLLRLPASFAINSKISKFKGAIFLSELIKLILISGRGEGARRKEEEERKEEEGRKKEEEEKRRREGGKKEEGRRKEEEGRGRTEEGVSREKNRRKEEDEGRRGVWLEVLKGCIILTKNKKIMRRMFCYPFLKYRALQMILLDWLDPLYYEIINVLLSPNCFEKDELYRLKGLKKKIQEEGGRDAKEEEEDDDEEEEEEEEEKKLEEEKEEEEEEEEEEVEEEKDKDKEKEGKEEEEKNVKEEKAGQRMVEEGFEKRKEKEIFYDTEEIKKWLNEREVMTEEVEVQGSRLFNYILKNNLLEYD